MGKRAVILGPDEASAQEIGETLEIEGIDPYLARNTNDAFDMLDQEDIGFFLCSIKLPEGSGYDICKEVKKAYPHVKVVLTSHLHSEAEAIAAIRSGADYYLPAPFSRDSLLTMIDALGEPGNCCAHLHVSDCRCGWYEFIITSSEDSLIKLKSFLRPLLKEPLGEEKFLDLSLAIEELGRNAIEWGNNNDVDSVVMVSVCVTKKGVTVKIEDQGDGFDVKEGLEKVIGADLTSLEEARTEQEKRPGGLGIHLTARIADRLVFNCKGNAALIHFALD